MESIQKNNYAYIYTPTSQSSTLYISGLAQINDASIIKRLAALSLKSPSSTLEHCRRRYIRERERERKACFDARTTKAAVAAAGRQTNDRGLENKWQLQRGGFCASRRTDRALASLPRARTNFSRSRRPYYICVCVSLDCTLPMWSRCRTALARAREIDWAP